VPSSVIVPGRFAAGFARRSWAGSRDVCGGAAGTVNTAHKGTANAAAIKIEDRSATLSVVDM
jgi:hypothetical protein